MERVKRYVARFDNSEKFGQYMWLEACKCGFEGQFTKWRMGAIMGREAFGGLKIHLQTTDASVLKSGVFSLSLANHPLL